MDMTDLNNYTVTLNKASELKLHTLHSLRAGNQKNVEAFNNWEYEGRAAYRNGGLSNRLVDGIAQGDRCWVDGRRGSREGRTEIWKWWDKLLFSDPNFTRDDIVVTTDLNWWLGVIWITVNNGRMSAGLQFGR
jgi:hypothetical protein